MSKINWDKIQWTRTKWNRTKCSSCGGAGFVRSKTSDVTAECGSCSGEGMYEDSNAFMQREYEIQDSVDQRYKFDDDFGSY